ncbi:MAG TPA: triphosphoribosyl-dephospho-CoA synthase CitG [Lachnospiraceae bacterium]|nr:triphosphoribosyl-dephospho-CoA synthase CitG [Lachnospiraceae bacterium]
MADQLTDGEEVGLAEMLKAREKRAGRQAELIQQYHVPLVSFGLNIAGPVKVFELARWSFSEGCEQIEIRLKAYGLRILYREESRKKTGCEAYFCVDGSAEEIKKILTDLEEEHTLGRLFDIDVLGTDGRKVSRTELGYPERTCLLCGRPAFECSRSRKHSVAELFERVCTVMWDFFSKRYADNVSFLAVRALLYEVMATPKPGLVDQNNTGSHKDMDIFTFETSALAILPYFSAFTAYGISNCRKEPETFLEGIRPIGIQAEISMRRATEGVNTHKGAIFSMGFLCAAIGRLYGKQIPYSRPALMEVCRRIASPIAAEMEEMKNRPAVTNGEKIYKKYGVRGIRGEAAEGFPTLFNQSLPHLSALIREGYSLNDAGIITLIYILASTEDTNLISRSSYEKMQEIKEQMKGLIAGGFEKKNYREILIQLDREFIRENLSPGGSADLLALTYFLDFYETGKVPGSLKA